MLLVPAGAARNTNTAVGGHKWRGVKADFREESAGDRWPCRKRCDNMTPKRQRYDRKVIRVTDVTVRR